MYSQKTTEIGPGFNEIYAGVPTEHVERLKAFRSTHRYKHLVFDGVEWEYISCGRGERTMLLLPGGLTTGESAFQLITAFEKDYRVIAPSYPLSLTMTGLCDGVAHILEKERVNQAHVFGGSYGGLVAQYFVRKFPDKARNLILSHTFLMIPKGEAQLRIGNKLLLVFPRSLFGPLLKLRFNKIFLSTLRAAKHTEFEFWRAYLNEALASDRMKEVPVHQNRALLEIARQPQFTAEDLKAWRGGILIIDSDDDPAITAKYRELLKNTYPQAQKHTFHGAGHVSAIVKREEFISIIRSFLGRMEAP
ncbi:MAG TPA: alpha/beta hydrolase [Blastocatellia bacterium]|nr:alpha/beta hydrolase [Blastocatellia bacterium]